VRDRIDELLVGAQKRLEATSEAIGSAVGNRTEKGTAREDLIRNELAALLPKRYALSRGLVLGQDEHSSQLDVVIHDSTNYPTLSYVAGNLFVPESVYGVISVRSIIRPADMEEHRATAVAFKQMIVQGATDRWQGFYAVFSFRAEGKWDQLRDAYSDQIRSHDDRSRIDLVCALNGHCLCDARYFEIGNESIKGSSVIGTTDHDMHSDACQIRAAAGPFAAFYQLILTTLGRIELPPLSTKTIPRSAPRMPNDRVRPPTTYQKDAVAQVVEGFRQRGKTEIALADLDQALGTPGLRDRVDPLYEPLAIGLVLEGLRMLVDEGAIVVGPSTLRST